jgi:hypothetical protein
MPGRARFRETGFFDETSWGPFLDFDFRTECNGGGFLGLVGAWVVFGGLEAVGSGLRSLVTLAKVPKSMSASSGY